MTALVPTADASVSGDFRSALSPTVLVTSLLLLIYVGTEASLANWAYTLETVTGEMSAALAGYSISGYWLGLTLGRLGMGQMVKYLGAVRNVDCSLMLLFAGLMIWWLLPERIWSLALIGFALAPIFPTTIWLVPQRLPRTTVPVIMGFLTSFGSLGGATLPSFAGWMSQQIGWSIFPALMLFLVVLMVILHRWLVRHAPAAEAIALEPAYRSE